LTKKDTDGMHLEFGNPEVYWKMMEKIVRREGIGDVLANGFVKAAKQIGRGAEERVVAFKGLEPRLTATMVYFPIFSLTVVDDRGWNARVSGETQAWSRRPWSTNTFGTKEERETFIKEGWFQFPKEYEKYILADFSLDGADFEPGCQLHAYDIETFNLTDSLGLCNFTNGFGRYSTVGNRARMAELVSSATGIDFDEAELTKSAKRQTNLVRAYNRRLGLTEKDDIPPKIYFEQDPAPPHQKLTPEVFKTWRDRYYEIMGWDKEGTPTKETLEKVGLGYVWEELKKRGIATEEKVLTGLSSER
jgi:aldehyde:ferredoxin oxidoreductase